MNGRTNAKNGGGAIRDGCAVLEVRALAYSQITAVRADGLTKKQNKGYIDLSNSDYWFYYIIIQKFELSNLIWTVTATDGTDTVSDTVIISNNKQYDINLDYTFYVYNQGNTYDSRTGGYTQSHSTGSIATFETRYIHIYQTATSSRGLALTTNNTFDMSQFKTLFVEYTHSGELVYYAKFGVRLSQDYADTSFQASASFTTQSNKTVGSVDLSSVNSFLRVGFYDGNGDCKIYRAWLERA